MTDSSCESLNYQIDSAALTAAEQLLVQLESRAISPAQAQIMASILLGAFNQIVNDPDFLKYITEISEYAASLPQPIEKMCYVMYRDKDLMVITKTGCTVSTSGAASKKWNFDTEREAQDRVDDLIKLTERKGFKLR